MKTTIRALMLAAVAGVAFTGVANAETIKLQVPFQFVAGEAVVPAGEYLVTTKSDSFATIRIDRLDGVHVATLAAIPAYAAASETTRVEFRKVGAAYVLSKVWVGSRTGCEMPTRRLPEELERAAKAATAGDKDSANIVWSSRQQ